MQHWHVTISTNGRHPAFPAESARRGAVRALGRVVGSDLVLFCIVDDHVHVVACCDRARAGRYGQALHAALSPAATALAVGPVLEGRGREVVAARWAAAVLCRDADISPGEVDHALAVPRRTGARLRAAPVDGHVLRAVRVRLALEDIVVSRPMVLAEPEAEYRAGEPGWATTVEATGRLASNGPR